MFFWLRKYMPQLLICAVLENKKHIIKSYVLKKKQIISSTQKSFEDKNKALEYIKKLSKERQLYYTGIFYNNTRQKLALANEDKTKDSAYQTLNLGNTKIYTKSEDLKKIKTVFASYGGLDFVFSPFALTHYLALKHKLFESKETTLCVYKHSIYVSMMIFKDKEILFSAFFENNFASDTSSNTQEDEQTQENEVDFSKLDALLDKIEYSGDKQSQDDLDDFSSDMNMCKYLFSHIQEFYNSVNGVFIEKLIIFNNNGMSDTVFDYIEGEIFIRAELIRVDTFAMMLDLMKEEIRS